jgi:hypothetical protein
MAPLELEDCAMHEAGNTNDPFIDIDHSTPEYDVRLPMSFDEFGDAGSDFAQISDSTSGYHFF